MTAPPISGGGVVVDGDKIRAVGPARELFRDWPHCDPIELAGCVLLPALVNGHAHLELSMLPFGGPVNSFSAWLLDVIGKKREVPASAWSSGPAQGAEECLRSGQGTIADVLSVPSAAVGYPKCGPRVLTYIEVIAPREFAVRDGLERAGTAVDCVPDAVSLWGLSPHSPYTVCLEAFRGCRQMARDKGWRLMVHLAESAAELEWSRGAGGPLVDRLYAELPTPPPTPPGCHPLDWLLREQLLDVPVTLVHAVHLDEDRHPRLIAENCLGVILCPRSNRNLAVGVAPGRALLDAGAVVGLGTDSILSAGDLNLWRDVVAAVDDYGWTPEEALAAATVGSARAHGIFGQVGSLEPGKKADLVAVAATSGATPWESLLADPYPAAVWHSGRKFF